MDKETLVSKLRSMSDKIICDHESVSLIMLWGNNIKEHTTAFDYVISAKWLNDYDQEKGMDIVLDYMYGYLKEEELKHISRVTIIHTDDRIVQDVTRNMGVHGGVTTMINCQVNNLVIPYAIIFESRREA